MRNTLRTYSSFQEAEDADRAFCASLSPQERLDLLLDLVVCHREFMGEAAERLERVYRVAELTRS